MFVMWLIISVRLIPMENTSSNYKGENEGGVGGHAPLLYYSKEKMFSRGHWHHSYLTLGIIQTLHKTDVFKGLWTGSGLSWSNMKHYQEMQTWRFSSFFVNHLQVFKRPPTWYGQEAPSLPPAPSTPFPLTQAGQCKTCAAIGRQPVGTVTSRRPLSLSV